MAGITAPDCVVIPLLRFRDSERKAFEIRCRNSGFQVAWRGPPWPSRLPSRNRSSRFALETIVGLPGQRNLCVKGFARSLGRLGIGGAIRWGTLPIRVPRVLCIEIELQPGRLHRMLRSGRVVVVQAGFAAEWLMSVGALGLVR